MGNVNGREGEDGDGNPTDGSQSASGFAAAAAAAADEDEIVGVGGTTVSTVDVATRVPATALMGVGESPPHSPGAAKSPLMFGPQNPVAPLQRPDEPNMSQLWAHASPVPEDISCEQGIPTMVTWSYGGREVAVEGSWDNWRTREPLQRSGKDFTLMKVLPSGVYQYRFIVDGVWRYASDIPWVQDEIGNYYNVLDLQDYVPEDTESISEFDPPLSPDYSYNNTQLSQEDFAKDPPLVPPHLNMTLMNVPPQSPLSRPQHVVLNHLYMQKGKSGPSVVALGTTHRFKSKYVTVVLYKSF